GKRHRPGTACRTQTGCIGTPRPSHGEADFGLPATYLMCSRRRYRRQVYNPTRLRTVRAFVGFAAIFGPVLVAVGLAYMTGPDSAPVIVLAGFALSAAAGIGAWGRGKQRGQALER